MSKSLPGPWRPGSWVPKVGVQLKCQQQQKEVGGRKRRRRLAMLLFRAHTYLAD